MDVGNPEGNASTPGIVGRADGNIKGGGGASASLLDAVGAGECPEGTGRGGDGVGLERVGPRAGTSLDPTLETGAARTEDAITSL
jgi:hypothetical protein